MTSSTRTTTHKSKQLEGLAVALFSLKAGHRDHSDYLDAIGEDIEDRSVSSAIDSLNELKDDYRDTADRIEKTIQILSSEQQSEGE